MRWFWQRRRPPPTIPPYRVPVQEHKPKPSGIVVEELDTSGAQDEDLEALRRAQTQTGFHRAWNRLTGKQD